MNKIRVNLIYHKLILQKICFHGLQTASILSFFVSSLFYIIIFVLFSNIFILCKINSKIWMDRLGHAIYIKFTFFPTVY